MQHYYLLQPGNIAAHVNIIVSYGSKINFLILLILTPRVSEFVLIK